MPLPDGHIFAVGDAGPTGPSDGAYNLALLRLADDASFDDSFGDAAHPGWASINIGGTATGTTCVRAVASDARGRAVLVLDAFDGVQNGCTGLIRVITDRLLDAAFEVATPSPNCPE